MGRGFLSGLILNSEVLAFSECFTGTLLLLPVGMALGRDLMLGRGGRGGGSFGAMGGTSSKSLISGESGGLGE